MNDKTTEIVAAFGNQVGRHEGSFTLRYVGSKRWNSNDKKIEYEAHPLDEFLKRDVDAYFVVSSSDTLFDISKKLFSNKKPILIEKPPGFTSAQTKELLAASEQYGASCI